MAALVGAVPLVADEDGRYVIPTFEFKQCISLRQTDSGEPQHVSSTFSVKSSVESEQATGADLDPIPIITLPAGATGTIDPGDFTSSGFTAEYNHESATEDGLAAYPPGDYTLEFRAPDDSCVYSQTVTRRDPEDTFASDQSNLRPRILHARGWRDGKLYLPAGNAIVRWESIGSSLAVFGDTEENNQVIVRQSQTGDIVFQGPAEDEGLTIYPQLGLPGQQGFDLNGIDGIVSGGSYDITLEKKQLSILIYGDLEAEFEFTIRTSFEVVLDPETPSPPYPQLHTSSDHAAGTFEIRWTPDGSCDYVVLSHLNGFRFSDVEQAAFMTPATPVADHVFSTPIATERAFFRVLTLPK